MVPHRMKGLSLFIGISAICLAVGVIPVMAASDIVLVEIAGQVEVSNPQVGLWTNVNTGTSLQYGDIVRTGPQSKAEIRFESGIIRMYENTILELPSMPQQLQVSKESTKLKSVFLRKGRSLFEVFKNRLSGGFEVSTPTLIAGVKGTTFRVTEDEKMKGVTVFEGIVSVTNRQRHEEMIEVMANHFTLLSEGRLLPAREFQIENPALEERREEQRIQARREDRLRDQIEKNRDVEGKAVSSSLRIDTTATNLDRTLNTTDSTVSGTTGTLDQNVQGENENSQGDVTVIDVTNTVISLP